MPDYPMLRMIERYGGWGAALLSLAPLLAALLGVALGCAAWWIAVGAALSAVAFILLRSYVELVRVMIDMLLPK